MKQAIMNDATLFTHLFNNELDKFLLRAIQGKNLLLCESGFAILSKNSFRQIDVVQRLKNYFEIGLIQNTEKFIHLKKLEICENCKSLRALEFSEMGKLVFSKIFE